MYTSDGVNKVWTMRHEGGSLQVEGHKTASDASVRLLMTDSWRPEFIQKLVEHRAEITRVIRNERAQKRRAAVK